MRSFLIFLGKPFFYLLLFIPSFLEKIPKLIHKKRKYVVIYQRKSTKTYVFKRLTVFIKQLFQDLNLVFFKTKKKRAKKKIVKKWSFPKGQFLIATVFLILVFVSSGFLYETLSTLPPIDPQKLSNPPATTNIYDRNGVLLYSFYKDEDRNPIKLSDVPTHMKNATIAVEDAYFYSHKGVSIRGITRAILDYMKTGVLSGGSTITQQLVKNTLLTPERTIKRKLREATLAIFLERQYSKDQILEMYLNHIPYGGTAYGIQSAAAKYFNKQVKDLTLIESAFLAGLPKSPGSFNSSPEVAIERSKKVLFLMLEKNLITEETYKKAQSEKLAFREEEKDLSAPHFVEYIREILIEKIGAQHLYKGGLSVYTTLDINLQNEAQAIVESEVAKLTNYKVTNGAVLVTKPDTGEILAMVGSRNYNDTKGGGNVNVVARLRQPGSSVKVITYAYAFTKGMTAGNIIEDSPVTFKQRGSAPYSPQNYDGKYRGKISLRNALAESRNVPAVKVLANYKLTEFISFANTLGISSWKDPRDYGLSITLGGGDVTLLELTQVYSTFANLGEKVILNPIVSIKSREGENIYKNPCATKSTLCVKERVLDERVAFMINDILSDNNARSASFGLNSQLVISGHPEVAVKTGTSNNLRDNLALGFNRDYLVSVWVGNNDNSPMARVASGVTGATPIWNTIMKNLLKNSPSVAWRPPGGLVKESTCSGPADWILVENVGHTRCREDQIASQRRSPVSIP